MTFLELIKSVELYLNIEGSETRAHVKSFINEAIIDFFRLFDWEKFKESITLTLNAEDEYDLDLLFSASWSISAVAQVAKTFSIVGNVAPILPVDTGLTVAGSTGNNGTYTVVSAVYAAGVTVVTVSQAIPDATADGTIRRTVRAKPFNNIVSVIGDDGAKWEKKEYEIYLQQTTKTALYSIYGATLYVEGETEIKLLYSSWGDTLVADTDSNKATIHYWDVVKKMAAILFMVDIGDLEPVKQEEKMVALKINSIKADENRTRKQGEMHNVSR